MDENYIKIEYNREDTGQVIYDGIVGPHVSLDSDTFLIFYNTRTGNNSTGDGSQSAPYLTRAKALSEAIAGIESGSIAEKHVHIVDMDSALFTTNEDSVIFLDTVSGNDSNDGFTRAAPKLTYASAAAATTVGKPVIHVLNTATLTAAITKPTQFELSGTVDGTPFDSSKSWNGASGLTGITQVFLSNNKQFLLGRFLRNPATPTDSAKIAKLEISTGTWTDLNFPGGDELSILDIPDFYDASLGVYVHPRKHKHDLDPGSWNNNDFEVRRLPLYSNNAGIIYACRESDNRLVRFTHPSSISLVPYFTRTDISSIYVQDSENIFLVCNNFEFFKLSSTQAVRLGVISGISSVALTSDSYFKLNKIISNGDFLYFSVYNYDNVRGYLYSIDTRKTENNITQILSYDSIRSRHAANFYFLHGDLHYEGTKVDRATTEAGTYSRTGNTVTVTITGHGYSAGEQLFFESTSGAVSTTIIAIETVPTPDTFTFSTISSSATSGGCNVSNVLAFEYLLTNDSASLVSQAQAINYYTPYHSFTFEENTVKNHVDTFNGVTGTSENTNLLLSFPPAVMKSISNAIFPAGNSYSLEDTATIKHCLTDSIFAYKGVVFDCISRNVISRGAKVEGALARSKYFGDSMNRSTITKNVKSGDPILITNSILPSDVTGPVIATNCIATADVTGAIKVNDPGFSDSVYYHLKRKLLGDDMDSPALSRANYNAPDGKRADIGPHLVDRSDVQKIYKSCMYLPKGDIYIGTEQAVNEQRGDTGEIDVYTDEDQEWDTLEFEIVDVELDIIERYKQLSRLNDKTCRLAVDNDFAPEPNVTVSGSHSVGAVILTTAEELSPGTVVVIADKKYYVIYKKSQFESVLDRPLEDALNNSDILATFNRSVDGEYVFVPQPQRKYKRTINNVASWLKTFSLRFVRPAL